MSTSREPVVLVEQLPVQRHERLARHVHLAEGVPRLLDLVAQPHLAVGDARRPLQVVDVVDLLQEHRDALEAVGDLDRHGLEVDAAHLLEVGELGDLEAVEHHLPADAPRAERRRLPVVLLEADVVLARLDAARLEALQVERLNLVGRRLHDHLELVVLEEPVRVLAEAAVVGAPRRLDVGDVPVPRAEHAQRRLRVRGARADLEVERLLDQAALRRPELGELEDEVLEGHDGWTAVVGLTRARATPAARGPTSVPSPGASQSASDAPLPVPAAPGATPGSLSSRAGASVPDGPQERHRLARQRHASSTRPAPRTRRTGRRGRRASAPRPPPRGPSIVPHAPQAITDG